MTLPEPEIFGASCARGCASIVSRVPQYVVYFALVLGVTRAAYPTYGWRTSLHDSAIGFVIFVVVGMLEREVRHALGRWIGPHERRTVAWVANIVRVRRARSHARETARAGRRE